MTADASLTLPIVSDADVKWVCGVLALDETAFSGPDGTDSRLGILKSHDTLDVEACPGSGKTTLLVAKLAIVARSWSLRGRGLCVLSHTNVARAEIQRRLGATPEGRRLLEYPHFIGTIHGFVNEFLALPWLRSLGLPLRSIDNQICEQHRRKLLRLTKYTSLAAYVRKVEAASGVNIVAQWRLSSPAFDVVKGDGQPVFKDADAPSFKQLRALCAECHRDGYRRHDEMFVWAEDLLVHRPAVSEAIRTRFPLLFMDEVQDTSEDQARLLHRLFMSGDHPVRRQRFGDSNQAIYEHADQAAKTDPFPSGMAKAVVANSHRFGPSIASFADALAVVPHGLVGCGPPKKPISTDTTDRNAIFLFDDANVDRVLTAYARCLQEVFTGDELRSGTFVAVGAVHRTTEVDKVPRSVSHYWPQYDHELAGSEPKPDSFCRYIVAGRKLGTHGECHAVLDKIAEALLRLARMGNPEAVIEHRRRSHRQLLQLLADRPDELKAYRRLVTAFGLERCSPGVSEWEHEWRPLISSLACAISGGRLEGATTGAFLTWHAFEEVEGGRARVRHDNVFRYPPDEPQVQIRLGSIHSVKGETHTATLVLETFFKAHHLKTLKPWLLGQRSGGGSEGVQNLSRLRQHYVAMTRPTNLLCLALRRDAINNEEEVVTLKNRGWRVGHVGVSGTSWL
jgi:hypothetical protein